MAGDLILHLTDDSFDAEIRSVEGPVLVDFWAAWCAPCREIAPVLEEMAVELRGKATVAKVDVDDNGDLAARFGIRNIPTLLVFKDGRMVDQVVGVLPKEHLLRLIGKHLS